MRYLIILLNWFFRFVDALKIPKIPKHNPQALFGKDYLRRHGLDTEEGRRKARESFKTGCTCYE